MSDYEERKRLTFEQAEGAEPIPAPLAVKQVSKELRARLWAVVYAALSSSVYENEYGSDQEFMPPWENILQAMHVYRDHRPVDEFNNSFNSQTQKIKKVFMEGNYLKIFGWLQWVLRFHDDHQFPDRIRHALIASRAAYRLLDDDKTIVPISSAAELQTLERALVDLSTTEFKGARSHLTKAAQLLTSGEISDSIRESIHSVESVVRVLEPHGDFSKALAHLESKVRIHGALKRGFASIYGFTSDENGIRHPLLEKGSSDVDETDAIFMIGACAAFVSYLINKSRDARLIS